MATPVATATAVARAHIPRITLVGALSMAVVAVEISFIGNRLVTAPANAFPGSLYSALNIPLPMPFAHAPLVPPGEAGKESD